MTSPPPPAASAKVASLKQVGKIRLGRENLERWVSEAGDVGAAATLASGCFVRVLLGERNKARVYRMAQVTGVVGVEDDTAGGTPGKVQLQVNWGAGTKPFKMDFISNGEFTQEEYEEWVRAVKAGALPVVTARQIDAKMAEIRDMIQRKQQQQQPQPPSPLPQPPPAAVIVPITPKEEPRDEEQPPKRRKTDDAAVATTSSSPNVLPPPKRGGGSGSSFRILPDITLSQVKQYYETLKQLTAQQSEQVQTLEALDSHLTEDVASQKARLQALVEEYRVKEEPPPEPVTASSSSPTTTTAKPLEQRKADAQRRFDEDMEAMRRESKRRERVMADLENELADVQRQVEKAKAVAAQERQALAESVRRREAQLVAMQKHLAEKSQKLQELTTTSEEQASVITLQDVTVQELEAQLSHEHAQLNLIQQKRYRQALALQQRMHGVLSLSQEFEELQQKMQELLEKGGASSNSEAAEPAP